MEEITVENFSDSLEKKLLDRLVEIGAKAYAISDTQGIECLDYKQGLWDFFCNEVLEKRSEEELNIFFNYENARYQTFSQKEDSISKDIAMMSNDMRYNLASFLKKDWTNLDEEVEKLASYSK